MANWCSNTVVFEGNTEAIEQIKQLFKSMAEKGQKENLGQLPDFVTDVYGGYFFNICQDDDLIGVFQYVTKWIPNTEAVKQIAEHYGVDFVQYYEESGNCVYGKATFFKRVLTDIFLEDEDFEQYKFDEETYTYHFEGNEWDSDYDILEILLERKIKKSSNNIKISTNETIR